MEIGKKVNKIGGYLKELTLKQAYKLYNELWEWLIKYPDKNKLDWPGWPKKDYVEADSLCFACEYVRQRKITKFNICFKKFFTGSCSYCPLTGLWGTDCMDYESPSNDANTRKEMNLIIANFCDKKLEELKNKKGA